MCMEVTTFQMKLTSVYHDSWTWKRGTRLYDVMVDDACR
jgi:hypothetical protein